MVAFLTLHYAFYPLALILFGVLLRTGVLQRQGLGRADDRAGRGRRGAARARRCCSRWSRPTSGRGSRRFVHGERGQAIARNIAKVPAVFAEGFRFAISLFTHPRQGGLAVLGAAGFWAANIGILWASFHAFGVHVPLAVVVQGFFLGMVANLIPFAPAGVGAVDAGMIGAFVLFGIPEDTVFPAILVYRLIAFWMPIPFGVAAFFQLRTTGAALGRRRGLPIDRARG